MEKNSVWIGKNKMSGNLEEEWNDREKWKENYEAWKLIFSSSNLEK